MNDRQSTPSAMQGDGFYNRHSSLQAAGISLALPLLEKAAQTIAVDGAGPIVIADYGSSQGRNSMAPMRLAIETTRARVGSDRPIEVIHADLPSNDFASLFTMLQDDPTSYIAGRSGIFPFAIGRSHFGPVLPPGRLHLGWSSWSLQWLSRKPADAPDHLLPQMSADRAVQEAVDRQLAADWKQFLLARSSEMREGAKLVTLFVGRAQARLGWEYIFGELWRAITDMGSDRMLSPEEQERITLPAGLRSVSDVEAPFASGSFAGLSLEHVAVLEAPDPLWERYCETDDALQLARSRSDMARAAWGPTIVGGLNPGRDGDAFLDDLIARFAQRIAESPKRCEHYLVTAVIGKSG